MGAGFESGLGAVGELAFGGPELISHYYNDTLHDVQGQQALGLGNLRKFGDTSAAAYAAALAASAPQFNQINQDTISKLSDLAGRYAGFDPTSTYERIRGGNIASLADQFVNLANYGQQGDKAALAARGYGGRGPGSYESILRSDRISRNIAPVLNTIYGNLGSDTAGLNQNRLANLAATMGILQARQGLPDAAAARELLPYEARLSMLGREVPLGGQLAESTKANLSGYEQKQNKWAKFFQGVGRSMDQGFDAFMSIYGGGALGGMGGLGGGAGGAIGGGTGVGNGVSGGSTLNYLNTLAAGGGSGSASRYGPYAGGYSAPPSYSPTGPYASGYEFPSSWYLS